MDLRRAGACLLLVPLVAEVLPPPVTTTVAAQQAATPKKLHRWKVKGSSRFPHSKAKLWLTDTSIWLETRSVTSREVEDLRVVPFEAIHGVALLVETREPVREARRRLREELYDPENIREVIAADPRAVVGVPLLPVYQALGEITLAPFVRVRKRRYYVQISLTNGETEVYLLGRGEAQSFLSALRNACGKNWEEVDLVEQVESGKGHLAHVKLNAAVLAGSVELSPGRWVFLFTEDGDGMGELYVLKDATLSPNSILARISVDVSPQDTKEPCSPLLTPSGSWEYRLEAFCFRSKHIRLKTEPAP